VLGHRLHRLRCLHVGRGIRLQLVHPTTRRRDRVRQGLQARAYALATNPAQLAAHRFDRGGVARATGLQPRRQLIERGVDAFADPVGSSANRLDVLSAGGQPVVDELPDRAQTPCAVDDVTRVARRALHRGQVT